MRILMFGRGVISTLYAWSFEKAGHQVDFYVRPGRGAQYGPAVDLEIRDARVDRKGREVKEQWPVTMRENLDSHHDYDLIVVSVNHDQLDSVIEFLTPRIGDATVLIFNNVWADPAAAVASLPDEQIVWGFPGAGGGFSGSVLRGGLVKSVFLGFVDGSNRGERYSAVRNLFRDAGFSTSEVSDFRSWLWFHFILDAGLMAGTLRAGGYRELLRSRGGLQEVVLLVREQAAVLKAKGGTPRLGAAAFSCLPAGLLGYGLRKLLSGDNMYSFTMEQVQGTAHANYEMTSIYPREVLSDARRLGVSVPRLAALEPVFK